MRSHLTWFVLLAACCVVAPYILRIRPRAPREWIYLTLTLAFLAWVLFFMTSVSSR